MADPFKDTRDPLVRSMERSSHQREVDEQKEIVVRMRKLNSKVIAERDDLKAALQKYGRHLRGCRREDMLPCDCGFFKVTAFDGEGNHGAK
jgi:hypothetical protein